MLLGKLLEAVYGKKAVRHSATKTEPKRRGLYYPPEEGEVYPTHRAWAGAQRVGPEGWMTLALVAMNPSVHRCRIGKITLKQANG